MSVLIFFFLYFVLFVLAFQMHIVHKVTDAEVDLAKTRMKAFLYQQVSTCRKKAYPLLYKTRFLFCPKHGGRGFGVRVCIFGGGGKGGGGGDG